MTDIIRVRTVFTGFSGAPGLMTNYFRLTGPGFVVGDAQNAVDRIKDAFTAHHANLPVAFRWTTSGQVDQLKDTNGEVVFSWTATPSTGTGTSSVSGYAPIASGVLIKWQTGAFVGGRRVVGKTFLVPTGNNTTDTDGTLTTGAAAEWNGWAASMLSEGLTGLHMVVWSRPRAARAAGPGGHPAALSARDGSSYPITSGAANDKLCVLTSRRD